MYIDIRLPQLTVIVLHIIIKSLYIHLNKLNGCVFITNELITTNPQLDIICSWLIQLFAEPRWVVELTAITGTPASLTVPEWIIRVECSETKCLPASSFTEVVLTDEGRYNTSVGEVRSCAGTHIMTGSSFIECISKCPDVLTRRLTMG